MGEIFLDASITWKSIEALDVTYVSLRFAPYSEQDTSAELDLFLCSIRMRSQGAGLGSKRFATHDLVATSNHNVAKRPLFAL